VSERGDEAAERVRELSDGFGVHSVLECVGLEQSMLTALSIARPGGAVGRVGVPQDRDVRLDEVADGYRAMADRDAIKVMVQP
jgi:threonine dehydrogenase-like Zn-dependent dehydrogenase